MAPVDNHESDNLASRLEAAADGIVNAAAAGLERDLREAGRRLRYQEGSAPPVVVPTFVSELRKIANTTTDAVTRERLRRFLGEA